MSFYGDASESDFWREFTNNFATDLAPIISLFGEQVTKQYLTESTTFLDSLVFAIAPLGVITAIVSVIRVRGTPFLRSLIGRAREPHGAAELELCSSTSQDVSEVWSNGGVCRVLGRPKILEFMSEEPESLSDYMPTFNEPQHGEKHWTINYPTCDVHLVKDVLSDPKGSTLTDHGWTEITPSYSGRHALWHRCKRLAGWAGNRPDNPGLGYPKVNLSLEEESLKADDEMGSSNKSAFAPYPNLSLNLGSRGSLRRASQLKISALAACLLQASFFGYITWATWYSPAFRGESKATEPLPFFVLCTSGTLMVTIGMTLSATLIDRNSSERLFVHKPSHYPDKSKKPRIFWLQPGEQRIGDQVFPSFSHNEERETYITSWKTDEKDIEGNIWQVRSAVVCSLLGWVFQFVGLRGLHASIGLYHLGVTLIMSFIRAILRSGGDHPRPQNDVFCSLENIPPGHEIDWQALQLGLMRSGSEKFSILRDAGFSWSFHDEEDVLCSKPNSLPEKSDEGNCFSYFYKRSENSKFGVVGIVVQPWHHISSQRPIVPGLKEATINLAQTVEASMPTGTSTTITTGLCDTNSLSTGARTMHIRGRFGRLTTSSPFTGISWDTEVRRVSRNLAEAIRQTLEYFEPASYENVLRNGSFPKDPELHAVIWCTMLHLRSGNSLDERSPVAFHALRNEKLWQVEETALEAAIGLRVLCNKMQNKGLNPPLCPWCGELCKHTISRHGQEKILLLNEGATEYLNLGHLPVPARRFSTPACMPSPDNLGENEQKYHVYQATSSPENLAAQDIYEAFLKRLCLISFGILGPLESVKESVHRPHPAAEASEAEGKTAKHPAKLVEILLSCNLASDPEARIAVYGSLLPCLGRYDARQSRRLDRSLTLADQLRMQGDNLSAELELAAWKYAAMSKSESTRFNRAACDLLRVRSARISYCIWKQREYFDNCQKFIKEFFSRYLDHERQKHDIKLEDKEFDDGYESAMQLCIEARPLGSASQRVLLPLEEQVMDELESEGRTSSTIAKALSLMAYYSLASSTFDTRCRLFRYALEHGLIGLLQDLYGEELRLPSSDRTVRGGPDQILFAVSQPLARQDLYQILVFLLSISRDKKVLVQPWQQSLDSVVEACLRHNQDLADFIHGARASFLNPFGACVLVFDNIKADTDLARMLFCELGEEPDFLLQFFKITVRWGQSYLLDEWTSQYESSVLDFESTYCSFATKLRFISAWPAALRSLTHEEATWAARHGFSISRGRVPRLIHVAVLNFIRHCREDRKSQRGKLRSQPRSRKPTRPYDRVGRAIIHKTNI